MTEAEASNVGSVWIADDDRSIRWVLSKALSREGIQSRAFENGDELLKALKSCAPQELPQALVTDIRMPGTSGLDLLPLIQEQAPNIPVIVMTAFTDLDSAVSSFQKGAFEYLTKPFDVAKAVALIKRAIAESQTQGVVDPKEEKQEEVQSMEDIPLIGQAPAMQDIFRAIGRLSRSTATVLLTGESGTGKEIVARTIWKHSPRNDAPFVAINVAAIPKELLESELFGHEKGAFTGAVSAYQGRFEQAKGGTLFLDEIGDMPMDLQTRLLRVLSNGFFYRIAGKTPIKADVRIIAATNKNLKKFVDDGAFREDLYYRLNVIHLNLPPLRERKEDIPLLVNYFLRTKSAELGVEAKSIADEALSALKAYSFPGNVRELENLVQWFLVMLPGQVISVDDIPKAYQEKSADSSVIFADDDGVGQVISSATKLMIESGENDVFNKMVKRVETFIISTALDLCDGNKSRAAQILGIGRNSLSRKKDLLR